MQVACEFNFGPWQLNINSVERETQIELRSSFFFVGVVGSNSVSGLASKHFSLYLF